MSCKLECRRIINQLICLFIASSAINTRLIPTKTIKLGAAEWLGRNGVIINVDFTQEKQSQEGLAFEPISLAHFISNLKTGWYSAMFEIADDFKIREGSWSHKLQNCLRHLRAVGYIQQQEIQC